MKITNRQAIITKYKMEVIEIDAQLKQLNERLKTDNGFLYEPTIEVEKLSALKTAYINFINEIRIIE